MPVDKELADSSSPLVAILGPTGSGKSAAGLRIAEAYPAEIVNCDSLQVYRYLNIGTAKLRPPERQGVPHHMMDLVDPDAGFNAGEFSRRARPIIRSIARSGKLPIVVGGTGFYFRALLDGLFIGPEGDRDLRLRLAARESQRPGSLHRILRRLDPASTAKIHPNDISKLIRALEVSILAKQPISRLYARGRDQLLGFRILKVILDPPREQLYEKLERRGRQMFDGGLVEEVSGLLAKGFPSDSKAFESLGYRQAVEFLLGTLSLEEAVASTLRATRRYAKRQWTWFRNEPGAAWVSGFGDELVTQSEILRRVAAFLRDL